MDGSPYPVKLRTGMGACGPAHMTVSEWCTHAFAAITRTWLGESYSYNPVPVRQAALSVSHSLARIMLVLYLYRNNIVIALQSYHIWSWSIFAPSEIFCAGFGHLCRKPRPVGFRVESFLRRFILLRRGRLGPKVWTSEDTSIRLHDFHRNSSPYQMFCLVVG